MGRMKRLIFILLLLMLPLVSAQDNPIPSVAWIVEGRLWLEGQQTTTPNACCALFSPQRTKLAYLETTETSQILHILEVSTQQPLLTLSAETFASNSRLGYLAWQNEDLLWLNTFEWTTSEGIYAPLARWDLWQVETATGSTTQVRQAGEGGIAIPSPDGTKFAVLNPGVYAAQFASVKLYDLSGTQLAFYEYPAVSSASEQAWFPNIHWRGDAVRFAVPDADLVYNTDPSTLPPTILLELSPTQITVLGEIQVDFPADILWSPDGIQAAYTRRSSVESLETSVFTWVGDTKIETEIFKSPSFVSLLSWDDSLTFYLPESTELVFASGETIENVLDFVSLGDGTGFLVQGDFENTRISYLSNGELTPIADAAGAAFLAR